MIDVARKHQKTIAYKTLRMTPAGARIMGGMTFEEAYAVVFGHEGLTLRERLEYLVKEYGNSRTLAWELQVYGWDCPADLLAQL